MIDLTSGEAKVLGNKGDEHPVRLSNPSGTTIIEPTGVYEAEFLTSLTRSTPEEVELILDELATGALLFTLTVKQGFYRIRRLNPVRTLITIEVEVR